MSREDTETLAQMQAECQAAQRIASKRETVLTEASTLDGATLDNFISNFNNYMGDRKEISIEELSAKFGVTKEDFQTLCDRKPDLLTTIGGGPTCEKLAHAADNRDYNGSSTHSCLTGVAYIYHDAGYNDLLGLGSNPVAVKFKQARPYQKFNGGEVADEVLEASGRYMVVRLHGVNNSLRTNVASKMQPGITLTTDSVPGGGPTPGNKYGHVAVATNNTKNGTRQYGSDFRQVRFNWNNYGDNTAFCIPRDALMPKETAEELLKMSAEHRRDELENLYSPMKRNTITDNLEVAAPEPERVDEEILNIQIKMHNGKRGSGR